MRSFQRNYTTALATVAKFTGLYKPATTFFIILDDAWDQAADWYHDAPIPERRTITAERIVMELHEVNLVNGCPVGE